MSDGLETEAVRLAIQAAGPIGGNAAAWLHRIQESVPVIAAILRPPMQGRENDPSVMSVTARKVLESTAFKAEYVDHALADDQSQRIIARFKSETTTKTDKESDGTEHIRTEPMWSAAGRLMRSKLDALTAGQDVVVYKHMEQIDAGRNVRVLVHLVAHAKAPEQRARPPVEQQRSPTPAAPATRSETVGAAVAPAVSHPSADETPHGEHWVLVQERIARLSAREMIAWRALAQGRGVKNFMDPGPDEIDRVILAFEEIEKNRDPAPTA